MSLRHAVLILCSYVDPNTPDTMTIWSRQMAFFWFSLLKTCPYVSGTEFALLPTTGKPFYIQKTHTKKSSCNKMSHFCLSAAESPISPFMHSGSTPRLLSGCYGSSSLLPSREGLFYTVHRILYLRVYVSVHEVILPFVTSVCGAMLAQGGEAQDPYIVWIVAFPGEG